jgi:hypothetical protein
MLKIKYSLSLEIGSTTIPYFTELTEEEECNPLPYLQKNRDDLRKLIQQKMGHHIQADYLDKKVIRFWASQIEEGHRTTGLTLDLPPFEEEDLENIQDNGYQELPALVPPDLQEIEPMIGALPSLDF